MAETSGTIGSTQLEVAKLVEHAWRRCQRGASLLTPEVAQTARELLYLLLRKMSNDGLNLWALEKRLLGLYDKQAVYDLPVGTQRITKLLRRQCTRYTDGTLTSSDGGTTANLVDSDVDTSCTQTAPNGNIQYDAGSGETIIVNVVGIMPNGAKNYALVFESSEDGASWSTRLATELTSYADGAWTYYDIDTPAVARYFRVREAGGGVLDLRELFLGTQPIEIPLSQQNRDEYFMISNRTSTGTPNLFWFDRQRDTARIWLWNPPNSSFTWHMILWRQRQLEDVGSDLKVLDVPERWLPAVISNLAADLSEELVDPPCSEQLIMRLRARADKEWDDAAVQEGDGASLTLVPAIGVYTR